MANLVEGNTAFAVDLYRELSTSEGNLFYSPYSISLVLAMAHAGARGETERQMAETLGFRLPQERLHAAFNALDLAVTVPATTEDGDGFEMSIANSVWGQQGHRFLPDYLDTLALNYGGSVRHADFRRSPGDAAAQINRWVSRETNGRINDLISPQAIDEWTRLALASAVYFKAGWQEPFEERATSRDRFYSLDGRESTVDMMRQMGNFRYAQIDGHQAVELPYRGGRVSMVVLLPAEERFREFEQGLGPDVLERVLGGFEERRVILTMPKFEIEAVINLVDALKTLGMPNAFDAVKTEFQGMDGSSCVAGDDGCLWISAMAHRAFVSVDEAGTEAAAATAIIMGITRAEPMDEEPTELTIDRSFIFLIRDRDTGSILFIGRVTKL